MSSVRVNRAKLHAFIERWADVIDKAEPPDDLIDLGPDATRHDAEALWRQGGVAALIGLAIYDEAEAFLMHQVHGGPDS